MKITENLVSLVRNTDYKNLTENCILEAKKCILDGIGITLAGSRHKASRILKKYVMEIGGGRHSTIFGNNPIKSSVSNSALVNGVACHVLDFDDTHRILGGHPTAVILPVVLALGEYTNSSGKDILTAFILGVEISCKIARGVNPYHYQTGYHVTSTIGVFGATAAAGKLLKLSNEELIYALGIAGSMSSGLKENFGTMTKSLHIGLAASNGIKAALLARKGLTASKQILEGELGFCNVLSKECQLADIIKDFGNPWEIENPGIARKKYPCCARVHTAIDGVLKIVNKHNITYEDLAGIECATDDIAFNILIHPIPKSELEAKFSMPFCLAVAFLEKDVFINHFTQEKIKDKNVINVMRKVNHVPDREITLKGYEYRWTSKVKIKLKKGMTFYEKVEKCKGDPQNPLSDEEIVEKFCRCAKGMLDQRKRDSIIEKIIHLEGEKDIRNMVKLFC